MAEFEIPDFLQGQSPEEIYSDMTEQMPSDIDISEGSHPYNYTFPTAYIVSRLVQFRLIEAIKMITPQFCQGYDTMAAYHGETRGLVRKAAVSAVGTISVTAKAGTVIPEGSIFSTVSVNGSNAVEFRTTEECIFETENTISIGVEAVVPGQSGNVSANTIIVKANDITGITEVTNPTVTNGGMDQESLNDFIDRIVEFDRNQGQSYIGNTADYKRWAEEVSGVGHASVIMPTNDTGVITIVITDQNGDPADADICAAVYNHIMDPTPLSIDGAAPEDEVTGLERLAPINARLLVIPPITQPITLSVLISIDTEKTTLQTVKTALAAAVGEYLVTAENYIYLSDIGAVISSIDGVIDYGMATLKVNGQTANIPIAENSRPTISEDGIALSLLEG